MSRDIGKFLVFEMVLRAEAGPEEDDEDERGFESRYRGFHAPKSSWLFAAP